MTDPAFLIKQLQNIPGHPKLGRRTPVASDPLKLERLHQLGSVLASVLLAYLEAPTSGVTVGVAEDVTEGPAPKTWVLTLVQKDLTEANIDHLSTQTMVAANNWIKAFGPKGAIWPFSPAEHLHFLGATDILFTNWMETAETPVDDAMAWIFRRYRVTEAPSLALVRDSRVHESVKVDPGNQAGSPK